FDLHDATEMAAVKRVYELAVRDALTQCHNRRYLDDRLRADFAFALRHHTSLTVLMVDLDHFKHVNDHYGHPAGDEVLRQVAAALKTSLRIEDVVARYGGEEFCVVARGTSLEQAKILAERVRVTVAALQVIWEGQVLRLSASVGVATLQPGTTFRDVGALIAAADQALYQAKRAGRNRAYIATPSQNTEHSWSAAPVRLAVPGPPPVPQ
ncbi:MAG: GGDEF domain-containing protein, partial [Polyangiales bacterium]